jgi:hypothetical protein
VKKQQKHIKHLPKNQLAEAYGWFGSILILSGYGLLSLGIISGNSPIYHLMFMVGSSGLAVITYRHRAFQSFTVNVLFTIFAFIAVIRIIYLA